MFRAVRKHIRSSTVKKDVLRSWSHAEKSIHNIKSWPPGAFILIDQRKEWERMGSPSHLVPFIGLGMVVANDGVSQIRVVWGANCKASFVEYNVETLNTATMYHVG